MPAPGPTGGGLPTWWRSSLRVRVITSTMALGIVLVLLLFNLLFAQIAQGLVGQAVDTASRDAAQRVRQAQEQFDAIDRRDNSSLNNTAFDVVGAVAPADQQTRAVLARSIGNDREAIISTNTSSDIGLGDVPMQLREALEAEEGTQQLMVTEVELGEGQPMPSVLIGSRVDIPRAGAYDLYLVYPMAREQETLDLVRRWFVVGGLGFLVLVGGVAWLASQMVTAPVGRAARVSQELATGRLDERLPVTGSEDELDRLALSFNTMADSLQNQIRQLETLSQLQQRFVSDVSHELRTPLTTIRMAGEVLHASRDEFSGPVARSAELLYGELGRFEELLTELLEISRYDSGAADLEMDRVDMVGVVNSAVAGVATLARHSGSTMTVHSSRPSLPVDMDQRRISRILRNLLGNAIEHGEGRPIEVAVGRDDLAVSVSVRDHGIGLDAEQLSHVFERFWRADSARTRTTGGTGLGLAISMEDAKLHGGWLQVTSRPGEGALFRLTLPQAAGSVVPEPPPPVLPPAPRPATEAPEPDRTPVRQVTTPSRTEESR
ncbi:MtrAB system histidine kinase MtrB [Ornithinicoccus hortensis]|uniref:Sensor histidine kinase MtrB n=1 Tax=Ornithinicoccus hortensis TaxID=82346 RepID=A0A542YQI6_9MICO|nr:MtrAB system histidine kinase MtrB [Ornithinicoccus hortensis]TQL50329.1 two-component system sensor histidine kinase MtrB [Ornithinicoccus hortensis]